MDWADVDLSARIARWLMQAVSSRLWRVSVEREESGLRRWIKNVDWNGVKRMCQKVGGDDVRITFSDVVYEHHFHHYLHRPPTLWISFFYYGGGCWRWHWCHTIHCVDPKRHVDEQDRPVPDVSVGDDDVSVKVRWWIDRIEDNPIGCILIGCIG